MNEQLFNKVFSMNLHEYQAKQLLVNYGLPVPPGEVAWNVEEAFIIADKMKSKRWVVKAQVHAGGRGKAGGVRIVSGKEELEKAMHELLGHTRPPQKVNLLVKF
jgi:succinyl-CoA synthetase beta subunit